MNTNAEFLVAIQQVQKARLEAEAANLLKDEGIAMVSHELRTALNGIMGWSELLLAGDLSIAETPAAAAAIHRQAKRQARLLDDLLDASHGTFNAKAMHTAPVDMTAIVASVVETMRPAAEAAGIRVDTASSGDACVLGDAMRLEQVLTNLLDNALKFAEPGGCVLVELSPAPGTVTIQVSDTGPGIDREFLPHVFERFRHKDASTPRSHRGLGLGLSIARDIVTRHGGSITARNNNPGSGATFTVSLPTPAAAEPASDGRAAVVVGPSSRQSGKKLAGAVANRHQGSSDPPLVLIVDNDRDTLALYDRVLSSAGFWVGSACRGDEALQYARALRPDAIVTDVRLPGPMDGVALIRRIRADAALREVPILVVTGHTPTDLVESLMATVLLKPVSPRTLVSQLEAVLARSLGSGTTD